MGSEENKKLDWTAATIAEALRAELSPELNPVSVTGFSIDSRTLKPGQCFIAIRGPRFDGHDFVQQALDRGASVCVVSREHCPGFPAFVQKRAVAVPDTVAALQELALITRRLWGRPILAVTGSVGKTTTKEMLATILASRYRVLKSEGNLNNEYGLPLSLLRLTPEHELAVLEMGMAHQGELARLCEIAEPNVGVVTAVAPVHLEFFSSVEEIAEAKRELIRGLEGPAVAVLNADDARVARFAEGFVGKVEWFGFGNSAGTRAENIEDDGLAGTRFDLRATSGRARMSLALPGRQHIQNALAACAAAGLYSVEPAEMRDALAGFRPAPMRGERISFPQGFVVVNDAYNSNPVALRALTEALSHTPQARRRLLVAGEMKELGTASPDLHRQAGRDIAALGNIDFLAGVTGDACHLVEGAMEAGLPADRARFYEKKEEAAGWLCDTVRSGDWVLLKASRGVALETVLDELQARFRPEVPAGRGRGE